MDLSDRLREMMFVARINQTQLAHLAGVSKGTVTLWMNGTTKTLSAEIAIRIGRATGFSNVWLATGEGPRMAVDVVADPSPVQDPRPMPTPTPAPKPAPPVSRSAEELGVRGVRLVWIKAQAGISGYEVDYVERQDDEAPVIYFKDTWLRRKHYQADKLFAIHIAGESMRPALVPGDLVVVNTDSCSPKEGKPFVVNYEGEVVVKRLIRDAGQWWLCSDNPDARRYPRKVCDDRTKIVGEVIYRQTEDV